MSGSTPESEAEALRGAKNLGELMFSATSLEPTAVPLQNIGLPTAAFGFSTRSMAASVIGYTPIRRTAKIASKPRSGRTWPRRDFSCMVSVDHPGEHDVDGLDRHEREDRSAQPVDRHVPQEGPLRHL